MLNFDLLILINLKIQVNTKFGKIISFYLDIQFSKCIQKLLKI